MTEIKLTVQECLCKVYTPWPLYPRGMAEEIFLNNRDCKELCHRLDNGAAA